MAIGFDKNIQHPGWVKPINFAGLPMLLFRNQDDNVNLFKNVCYDRSIILADTAKQLRCRSTCANHAWAFDLGAVLRKTSHVGGPNINLHNPVKHHSFSLNAVPANL